MTVFMLALNKLSSSADNLSTRIHFTPRLACVYLYLRTAGGDSESCSQVIQLVLRLDSGWVQQHMKLFYTTYPLVTVAF